MKSILGTTEDKFSKDFKTPKEFYCYRDSYDKKTNKKQRKYTVAGILFSTNSNEFIFTIGVASKSFSDKENFNKYQGKIVALNRAIKEGFIFKVSKDDVPDLFIKYFNNVLNTLADPIITEFETKRRLTNIINSNNSKV